MSSERTRRGIRVVRAGLLINSLLVVVKIGAGVIGHSYALIADGVESTLDIFSSLIVWRGIRIASRSADEAYHYGYGKAESVAAAAVALLLIAAAVGIAIEAVREIMMPHFGPAPFTLLVLIIVIGIKETLFRYTLAESTELESVVMRTDAWHHRSDAITSAAAFLGIGIALVGGPGWAIADEIAALVASAIIAFNGIRLLRPAMADLMDRAPDPALLDHVADVAEAEEGVRRIERVIARRGGAGHFIVVHVEADPELSLREAHELGHRVRDRILRYMANVIDAVIHMEPYEPEAGPGGTDRRVAGHRPRKQ